ncbi:arginine repressor [Yimella sp. cx-573]|nr:arginine repressor [Yimella sp. cx-573]
MITGTRASRHQAITDLLTRHEVQSQTQLSQLLAEQGFSVTQATLSRDLDELGAVKLRREGQLVYAVAAEGGDGLTVASLGEPDGRLRKVCNDLLVSAECAENLVVLKTPPGGASLLASAIDHARPQDVLGTIAGDDTIMVITASRVAAPLVTKHFLQLAQGQG